MAEPRTISTLLPRLAVEDVKLGIIDATKRRHRDELGDDGELHQEVLALADEPEGEGQIEPWRAGIGKPGDVLVRSTLTPR